ncbi:MAG TPA: F0F1 ATP synthase subunit B [Acidimicrobiales bacterium]|nr:F0F1 ATP synthase subunit B [Acidimicrobiales bacterium]
MVSSNLFLLPGFTFVLELIAFLIVLWIVAKYVLPPLRKAMDERADHIRNSIQAAEDAKREADELASRRRELLEGARQEARAIIDQANEIAEQLREDGRRRGVEEHDRLVASAQVEIDLERDRARSEVMSELGSLVLEAAERVIGAGLDDERHRALVEEAITAAQASSTREAGDR